MGWEEGRRIRIRQEKSVKGDGNNSEDRLALMREPAVGKEGLGW